MRSGRAKEVDTGPRWVLLKLPTNGRRSQNPNDRSWRRHSPGNAFQNAPRRSGARRGFQGSSWPSRLSGKRLSEEAVKKRAASRAVPLRTQRDCLGRGPRRLEVMFACACSRSERSRSDRPIRRSTSNFHPSLARPTRMAGSQRGSCSAPPHAPRASPCRSCAADKRLHFSPRTPRKGQAEPADGRTAPCRIAHDFSGVRIIVLDRC